MVSPLYEDWTEYFIASDFSDKINKDLQKELLSEFNHSHEPNTCSQSMQEHEKVVFMGRIGLGGDLAFFHHFKRNSSIAGNQEPTVLIGMEQRTAQVMTIDSSILFTKPTTSLKMPTPTALFSLSSADEVINLAEGSQTFKARTFVPVPPFLLRALTSKRKAQGGKPHLLLMTAIIVMKEFDDINKDDDEFPEKSREASLPFLHWLYTAAQADSPIKSVPFAICEDEETIKSYQNVIEQVQGRTAREEAVPHQAALQALTVSSIATQEAIHTMLTTGTSSDKASKSFSKLAPQYSRMLLVAGSVGEAIPTKLSDDGMEFFSQSSEKNALIYLNTYIEQCNLRVQVPAAIANQLHHGCFKWESMSKPSGLAASCLEFVEFERREVMQEGLVIDLATRYEMTSATIDKLSKAHVILPKTAEDLIERLKALRAIAVMIWGEAARLPQRLIQFVHWLEQNRLIVAGRVSGDGNYIARIMLAVDERINLWLRSCMQASHGMETSDYLIDFAEIGRMIHTCSFTYNLPSGVQQLDPRSDESHRSKKQRRDGQFETKTAVTNKNIDKGWKLRAGESYEKVFAGQVRDGPLLSMGCAGCHRYHNKGYCWEECPFALSHKKLTGRDWTSFNSFVKKCRKD